VNSAKFASELVEWQHGGVRRPVGHVGEEGGKPMPVAHLNDIELFYVEVGVGQINLKVV
jgi:hypothetical protein